jgi:hypothetical protein
LQWVILFNELKETAIENMKETSDAKRTYTIEELDELKAWFESRKDVIPQTMQIDSSAYTPNLPETLSMLFEQAYICYNNPKMQGCIVLLNKIRKHIEGK